MNNQPIQVSIIDDHSLFRKGVVALIREIPGFNVLSDFSNGQEFIDQLTENLPDIILMDIDMPVKNGFQTTQWLKENHPEVKVLALSMYHDELSIIKMLKSGAKGYLLKDVDPENLRISLEELMEHGYTYSELVTKTVVHNLQFSNPELNETEEAFIRLCCSEMTYKEIADKMNISPRTVDGYRESLFEKLSIKNRIGLVIYGIKNGIHRI
ncbi:MAG: response regulator transcription factor [Cyclobacteriaceae bacterium]